MLYGLLFDLKVNERPNTSNSHSHLYDGDCWNSSLHLRIEDALTNVAFNEEFTEQIERNQSSYGGSDAASWLLALGQSTLLSLALWQPLTYVYHDVPYCPISYLVPSSTFDFNHLSVLIGYTL